MDVSIVEMYLWWLRQYSSDCVLESLFNVAYKNVSGYLHRVRTGIVDNVCHLVAGFDVPHEVTADNYQETYGTEMSKLLGDTFFGCATVLGSVYCTYNPCKSMDGIKCGKALFNAVENMLYTMAKVFL